jgi:hypothetical protein
MYVFVFSVDCVISRIVDEGIIPVVVSFIRLVGFVAYHEVDSCGTLIWMANRNSLDAHEEEATSLP